MITDFVKGSKWDVQVMQLLVHPNFIFMNTQKTDFTNMVFGKLTVLCYDKKVDRAFKWFCKCECGNVVSIRTVHLKSGKTKSCGCLKTETHKKIHTTHGYSVGKPTPEYRAWLSIKERCLNKKSKAYTLYGGRGIMMSQEWQDSFLSFLSHIGIRPSLKHSVDRYPDKNGNYERGNVRWATQKQQCTNQNKNVVLTLNGVTMVMADWARFFNVHHEAIRHHLKKGRTIQQIASHYERYKNNPTTRRIWKEPHSL